MAKSVFDPDVDLTPDEKGLGRHSEQVDPGGSRRGDPPDRMRAQADEADPMKRKSER
jgi:hypothetical protein